MAWKPRVTVASVIEHEGRFLMVEEMHSGQMVINQPAGHMEHGENLLDAVRRETLEETAYRFEPTALLGVFHRQHPDPDRVYMRFTFTGTLLEPEPVAGYQIDPDITAVHWLTLEEIHAQQPRIWRSELVGRSLDAYQAGVRHSLDLLHYFLETD
ncbi:MAG: NUDIX hydrolase [Gammaproteobacteria bacterium]|nr:NUDIX hydrolase [Gammaproteobacteria bacterium]MBU1725007.1 NUDIX hydrolase [Gammaproteobacteria bacterium]MBU2003899.1 NUDIX hydrolase [Gammaproteobacteria bacterium]